MRDYPRDTGKFYALQDGTVYVYSIREDRQGYARVKWTSDRHEAKVWATREGAQRNADSAAFAPGRVSVVEIYR